VSSGSFSFGWRSEGYDPEFDRYRGNAGLVISDYAGGYAAPQWRPKRIGIPKWWDSVQIPLWIPLFFLAVPSVWLWRRDRYKTRAALDRIGRKLCPAVPVRITFRLIAVCFAIHFAFVFMLGTLLRRYGETDYLLMVVVEGIRILTIAMPVLAPLWAWLIVRYRNRLLRKFGSQTNCAGCGYDLTGNISGRCPECGQAVGGRAVA
jgi:hypothetical protein